jgi:predicted Ser/Thr protein kinase
MTGQTFEHYEIEEQLGKGGMGVVYRARDTRLGRSVALKVLPPELTGDEERKTRFKQEAKAAAAVSHPAIAQIYDVGEGPEGFFIAMELVEGKTVKTLIQGRELDLLGAIEIAIQVAGGLQKAHEAGIVHRDIKPENVVVTPDGHAKILDFGLAKLLEPPKESAPDGISHLETLAKTQAGFVLGTLRYMSPEQARGQAVDSRSDIFSLGIVLYEMVTGQLPFSGSNPLDTLHAIAFEETRPITAVRPNLPPSLQRVVTRCLRKRAADRYADAKELAADLKTVQREVESGISSKAPLALRLQERWRALQDRTLGEWLLPAVIAAVVLAVALSFFFGRSGDRSDDAGPGLVFTVIGGLLVWRRIRNRRVRLARRFTTKVKKMAEVRLVALDGMRFTVVADKAQAGTYVRANAALDAVNGSMFFGDPFTLVVRDDVGAEDEKALLAASGILYVREPPRLAAPG